MKTMLILAGLLAAGVATPVLAANANHPYQNCDKKVDNCGPTGNETTDQLNAQQLGGSPTTPMPGQMPMQGDQMPMRGQMPARP